jgi:hypothetical protein
MNIGVRKIKIGNNEFPVFWSTRASIEFKNLSGHNLPDLEDTQDRVQFFYCIAKAGTIFSGQEFKYSFDEFLNVIDPYYLETITVLSEFMVSFMEPGGEGKKRKPKSLK